MRRSFLAELYWRNPLLTLVAWLHMVLLLATCFGLITDDRVNTGGNAWLEPAKFMFSIAVYLWTIAWFSKYIRRPRWLLTSVSIVIATTMIVASACVLLQAARGITPQYSVTTDFDAAIFQTMGIMIGVDMFMMVVILFMFSRPSIHLRLAYLWSIRAGLVIFLGGGVIGGLTAALGTQNYGAPGGGPGLPLLNGNSGDLRIAHALALHALQVLPVIGYAISCWSSVSRTASKLALLAVVVVLYAGAVFMLYREALAGS
jgi:hypothetical protein